MATRYAPTLPAQDLVKQLKADSTPGQTKASNDWGSVTAAATIAVAGYRFVNVTGNTNITSVTATSKGHIVTLIFSGTPTFTDGSNLKLNGNLVASADDTITLVCDGTNWLELNRSAN